MQRWEVSIPIPKMKFDHVFVICSRDPADI